MAELQMANGEVAEAQQTFEQLVSPANAAQGIHTAQHEQGIAVHQKQTCCGHAVAAGCEVRGHPEAA